LDDLKFIQEYFKSEERNPTETELKVLDTYWSDHCRHTTFETELSDIQFEGQFKHTLETIFNDYIEKRKFLGRELKPISLMDLATVCGRYFHKTGNLKTLWFLTKSMPVPSRLKLNTMVKKNLGIYYSKTKRTITRQKLNLLVVLQLV
jgi:phosphoribosylformylglycinamidine (FGAM) synthase-like enzyme